MLLSYHELRREIQANGIVKPLQDSQVNASSIDVRLGAHILVERAPADGKLPTVNLRDRESLEFERVDLAALGGPFILGPGQFILAHTLEVFNLPLNLSMEFRLNSSASRMGLGHALAVWCDAGWHGSTLTLELHNLARHHQIALHYQDRIGQVIFHRHAPVPRERSYAVKGAYNGQLSAMPAQPAKGTKTAPEAPIPATQAAVPAVACKVTPPWEAS